MAIDPCQSDHGGCSAESARCVYDGPGRVKTLADLSHHVCNELWPTGGSGLLSDDLVSDL